MAYNYEYPYVDPGMYNDDWLLKKMKQLVAEWDAMQVKFTTLEEYVKNYFANLDVQDEINNKIDAMLSDGTLLYGLYDNIPYGWNYGSLICIGNINNAGVKWDSPTVGGAYTCLGYTISGSRAYSADFIYEDVHIYNGSMKTALANFHSSHPGKKYRNIFYMLSPIDLKQPVSVLVNAIIEFVDYARTFITSAILVPAPVPTYSPSVEDITNYYSKQIDIPISTGILFADYMPYINNVNSICDDNYNVTSVGARYWGVHLSRVLLKDFSDINIFNYSGAEYAIRAELTKPYNIRNWIAKWIFTFYSAPVIGSPILINMPFDSVALQLINNNSPYDTSIMSITSSSAIPITKMEASTYTGECILRFSNL